MNFKQDYDTQQIFIKILYFLSFKYQIVCLWQCIHYNVSFCDRTGNIQNGDGYISERPVTERSRGHTLILIKAKINF